MLALEQLEERLLPSINPPVPNPEITIVSINADPQTATVQYLAQNYLSLVPGVGAGSVVQVIQQTNSKPMTMSDIYLDVQNLITIGSVVPGPHTLVLVELDQAPIDNTDASYHSEILDGVGSPLLPFSVVWQQPNYTIPLTHELNEASAGWEDVDPVSWQYFWLGGYKVSDFVLPNGSIYTGPPATIPQTPPTINQQPAPTQPQPSFDQLYTLALEEYQALFYGTVARYFGSYQQQALDFQQAVRNNPAYGTSLGAYVVQEVDLLFMENWHF